MKTEAKKSKDLLKTEVVSFKVDKKERQKIKKIGRKLPKMFREWLNVTYQKEEQKRKGGG